MPQGKEAEVSGTTYPLITGLGSGKKHLFVTRLLRKGAGGSGTPPLLPMRRVGSYALPRRLPPLGSGLHVSEKTRGAGTGWKW